MEIKGYNESGARCKYDIHFERNEEDLQIEKCNDTDSDLLYECDYCISERETRTKKVRAKGNLIPIMEILIKELLEHENCNCEEISFSCAKRLNEYYISYRVCFCFENRTIKLEVSSTFNAYKVLVFTLRETTGIKVTTPKFGEVILGEDIYER